jgi:hypothetical protein
VYATEAENLSKRDSCYLEKERIKIQCPVVNRKSPAAEGYFDRNKFEFFYCKYPFELGMPDSCVDRKSGMNYFDRIWPNWKINKDWIKNVENTFCDTYIRRREQAQNEAKRLQEEQKRREDAERGRKKAEEEAKKRADEASRLQQQLDEANRRLQTCKR